MKNHIISSLKVRGHAVHLVLMSEHEHASHWITQYSLLPLNLCSFYDFLFAHCIDVYIKEQLTDTVELFTILLALSAIIRCSVIKLSCITENSLHRISEFLLVLH